MAVSREEEHCKDRSGSHSTKEQTRWAPSCCLTEGGDSQKSLTCRAGKEWMRHKNDTENKMQINTKVIRENSKTKERVLHNSKHILEPKTNQTTTRQK